MTGRLDPKPRLVLVQVEVNLCVGYENCTACGAETPEPSAEFLQQAAVERLCMHAGTYRHLRNVFAYLWPGDVASSSLDTADEWLPTGWAIGPDGGLICPDCSKAVTDALAARRKRQP